MTKEQLLAYELPAVVGMVHPDRTDTAYLSEVRAAMRSGLLVTRDEYPPHLFDDDDWMWGDYIHLTDAGRVAAGLPPVVSKSVRKRVAAQLGRSLYD